MAASKLSRGASAILDARVDSIFDRLLARLLGHAFSGKRLFVSIHPGELTIPSLFEHATTQEGGYVDKEMLYGLAEVAKDYLDRGRAEAKALTKRRIQGLLTDVDHGRLEPENFRNAVESELIDTWDRVRSNVERVVDTESQHAVSIGTKSAIDQLNTNLGISDPLVAWLPVKDASLCDECRETHLLPDNTTPRVWRSSEVSSDYHVRGEDKPSWHNMHPHCRCALVSIFPGFGFDAAGRVTYIEEGWDEYAFQRGGGGGGGVSARRTKKGEEEYGALLAKTSMEHRISGLRARQNPWPESENVHWKARAYGGVMFNSMGQVLIRAPSKKFGGYSWTWPKGRLSHKNEKPLDVAHREVLEETGHKGHVLGHLPGTFSSGPDRSVTHYWVMQHDGAEAKPTDSETQEVKWVHPQTARRLLGLSSHKPGAARDVAVLDAALKHYGSLRSQR